ncbi:hypothetical protein QFC21_003518 [Naganishia friedmannii]|uniref:Uncharacterized protein n=1 Tax=Naganishia friedmannii TaxID=89922 RepID=A0ACC2VM38_9TREE|nr:hypothetical protein QFC21_003518 [Naganishia friedmannii]
MPDSTTPRLTTLAEQVGINFYAGEMESSDGEPEDQTLADDQSANSKRLKEPIDDGTGRLGPTPPSYVGTEYMGYTIDPLQSQIATRQGGVTGTMGSGRNSLVYTPGKDFVPTVATDTTALAGTSYAAPTTNKSKIESQRDRIPLHRHLYDHHNLSEHEEKQRRVMVISLAGNGSKYSTRIRDAVTFTQLEKATKSAGTEGGTSQIWELTNGVTESVGKAFKATTCDDAFLSALNVPVEKVFESMVRALSLDHKNVCRLKLQAVEQRSLHSGDLIGKADLSCIPHYHDRSPEVIPEKRHYKCYKSA